MIPDDFGWADLVMLVLGAVVLLWVLVTATAPRRSP